MSAVLWIAAYIGSIVLVNWGFSHMPALELAWSLAVGSIFVTRDMVQRQIGHWCALPMLAAIALSYILADPFVALASVCAFAVSETVDWLVFTITGRPLRDRLLLSTAASAPVDSAIFLGMIGALTPTLFGVQVAVKISAAALVWISLTAREKLA